MIPLESTYRLQFHAGFTFADAAAIIPYLHSLGITHVYASPYLKARAGSTHGYDVIDHCSLNPELGSTADYERFLRALAENGMSHILDIVPNHVGVATNDNLWWNDVLEFGRDSKYAGYFDITWEGSPRPELHNKLLLPVLGRPYGDVLDNGELKLAEEGGKLFISYYDRRFPISPESREFVLAHDGPAAINASTPLLHKLLSIQHYRLACWRTAADEINYRRFFDINELAALAQERPKVFDATHALVLRLVSEGKIAGLRVDHPDGLLDPAQYFHRLRAACPYIVAEKILAIDERLPPDWPVDGTTGYDFITLINNLFVNARNENALSGIYRDLTHQNLSFEELTYQKKKLILRLSLASELAMLAHRLDCLARQDPHSQDFTLNSLLEVLRETIASFPVYRTYITGQAISETDRRHIRLAISKAIGRASHIDPSPFRFLEQTLLLEFGPESLRAEQIGFLGKFQQLTAPTTAKGIEDTAFYIYNRLVSLNEVGGDPATFGLSPAQIHAALAERRQRYPRALSPLSTHDTKRSEDVRARLNILSELPDEWRTHAQRWFDVGCSIFDVRCSIHPNDLYLLFQTLLGAWPVSADLADEAFISRIQAYMQKALREAKEHTSWTHPDTEYETALCYFIKSLITSQSFLDDFLPFQKRVATLGLQNSLSQTLVRLTAPGVPDTYQGTELYDLSLVDPDNRRPVDFALRQRLLGELASIDPPDLLKSPADPRLKLYITRKTLNHRRAHPGLYSSGDYIPLQATGPRKENVFAFLRRRQGVVSLIAVPRLVASIPKDGWSGTHLLLPANLPPLHHLFTGAGPVDTLASLFADFPVALLTSHP